ncbi:MAG: caspase family protein [Cyanobacteria bacterium CRU_2_1]|nr:caspase family protein [Cyanobacteria bacterium CRU_2_1]
MDGHAWLCPSYIDQSGASTIIFFIDACREGVKLGFKDTYLAGWSRGERRQATRRSFVVVFACEPGQVSQYVGDDEGFSLFSKALAEVLDPQHPAASLEDVLKATQERLSGLVAEH